MMASAFQSTLPVGGATPVSTFEMPEELLFQSTLPVGGATIHIIDRPSPIQISIHAPRGGSDVLLGVRADGGLDFNPRSPWGERRCPSQPWERR